MSPWLHWLYCQRLAALLARMKGAGRPVRLPVLAAVALLDARPAEFLFLNPRSVEELGGFLSELGTVRRKNGRNLFFRKGRP